MARLIGFMFLLISSNISFGFEPCSDFTDEPVGASRLYEIVKGLGYSELEAVTEDETKGEFVFEVLVEDVRFTTYKCWDTEGNLTGFDVELITEVVSQSNIKYIKFLPTKWENLVYNGEEQLSFFAKLNEGIGHAALAGMSIIDERLSWGNTTMVGPIYKAGKFLMARKDNLKISSDLLNVPNTYEPLRGLSVVVQGSNIRGHYFKKLKEQNPDLIEYAVVENNKITNMNKDKLMVIDVEDYAVINEFVDSLMTKKIYGIDVDLVMVDTGSKLSLIEEGKLGDETELVSANLGSDPMAGDVFGIGDGIAVREDSQWKDFVEERIKNLINDGTVNELVEKWFKDENSADHEWAKY